MDVGIRVFDGVRSGAREGVQEGSGPNVRVGVKVKGKRESGVMVGTGNERATCKVAIRS